MDMLDTILINLYKRDISIKEAKLKIVGLDKRAGTVVDKDGMHCLKGEIRCGDSISLNLGILKNDGGISVLSRHHCLCKIVNIKHNSSTAEYINPLTEEIELQEIPNSQLLKIT